MEKEKASLKSEISGFILFFCGLVIALSYISFNYHSSLFFIKNPAPPSNLIGYAGNVLASAGFYLFGIGCYFIPAVLFFIAVNMMRSRKILPLLNQIILITAIFFFSAVWLDNFFYHKPARGDIIIHKGMKFEVQGCKNLKISILYGGQKAYIPWNNEIKIYSKRPFRLTGLYPRFVHKIFLSLGRTGSLLTETFLLILFLTVLFRFSLYNFFSGAKLFIFNFLKKLKTIIGLPLRRYVDSLAVKINTPSVPLESNRSGPKADVPINPEPVTSAAPEIYFNEPPVSSEVKGSVPDDVYKPPVSGGKDPDNIDRALLEKFGDDSKRPAVLNFDFTENTENGMFITDTNMLQKSVSISHSDVNRVIQETIVKLESTLQEFSISAKVVSVFRGPVITRFELTIDAGIKVSRIVGLADNIALSLAAPSVRIVAPIPGKSVIGIEIPNINREMVMLRDILDTDEFRSSRLHLPVALGKSLTGAPVIYDLAQAPHLLIAGATGSGKSVCVNSIIVSLLFMASPSRTRLMLIDPKMVELNIYNGIPHLISPVITDAKRAALGLRWLIAEMESRYYLLEKFGARSIESYNLEIRDLLKKGEDLEDGVGTLPFIVVVIDEFADLMMVAQKEIEDSVSRLAAMSRAVGIHLILATQRPSVDVITGVIKANFPTRIAFQVASKIDSRTIIDINGADKLLGKGDMLFSRPTDVMPERLQGTFLSDKEVKQIAYHLQKKYGNRYIEDIFEIGSNTDKENPEEIEDTLFNEAVEIVIRDKKASASYLQRKLKIGYNRAARIVEIMEDYGIVGEASGSKPREVLINEWKPR